METDEEKLAAKLEKENDIDLSSLFVVNDKTANYYRICYNEKQINI